MFISKKVQRVLVEIGLMRSRRLLSIFFRVHVFRFSGGSEEENST